MIAHVVLFRPRANLSPAGRTALVAAFETALREIPSIRRANVGRRLLQGHSYEALMKANYEYAAVLEFDDASALNAYLAHPAHQQLSVQFYGAFEQALMYDFEVQEGEAGVAALRS
jgi:hypothetical protein